MIDEKARGRQNATGQVCRVYGANYRAQLDHKVPDGVLGQEAEGARAIQGLAGAEGPRRAVQVVRIGPPLQVYVRVVVQAVLKSLQAWVVVIDKDDSFFVFFLKK